MFTQDEIYKHFLINPDWKEVYTRHFPGSVKNEDYENEALAILFDNDYEFKITDRNKGTNNITVMCRGRIIKDNKVIIDNGTFLRGDWIAEERLFAFLLDEIIKSYYIDFSTFK